MVKSWGESIIIVAATLLALATLPILPAAPTTEPEPHLEELAPAKAPDPAVEPSDINEKIEKLALERLIIERPAPTPEPAPAPEPVPEKKPERPLRAGVVSVPVLPGPARQASRARPPVVTEKPESRTERPEPRGTDLLLSVPRVGLEDIPVGDSPEQSYLDQEGIMHLSGTGFPRERGSNTYIAGHADYDGSRLPSIFRNLKDLRQGDLITLRDATGKTYDYRVYERLVVTPYDVWVTRPTAGRNIVSLQTCFPEPTFEQRLIVRGGLVN